jgi:diguanylate cyclase (GGDEF)-like protein
MRSANNGGAGVRDGQIARVHRDRSTIGMHGDILLIDDDPGVAQVMGQMLVGLGNVRFASDGRQAIAQVRRAVPDLILLDAEMPETNGFDLCRILKGEARLKDVPVIFVTGHTEQEFEVTALECGAADFINKPPHAPVLRARVLNQLTMRRLTEELREQAMTDGLTQLANRRQFDSALSREWKRAWRNCEPISLVMIDIDHFKAYNGHYGHPAGDDCLRQVAVALAGTARRPCDLVARYGGEEFVALLPQTNREGAMIIAQRMLQAVNDLTLPHAASEGASHVTVSIGLSVFDEQDPAWTSDDGLWRVPDRDSPEAVDLLKNADRALRKSKRTGRARINMRDGSLRERKRNEVEPEIERAAIPASRPAMTPSSPPALRMPPVATGEWPHINGIDWEQSRRSLAGNRELFGSMLTRLVDEFGSLDTSDVEQEAGPAVTARLHKLKGSAGILGATSLQNLAARAEQAMKAGDRPVASELVGQVHVQIDRLRVDCAVALRA